MSIEYYMDKVADEVNGFTVNSPTYPKAVKKSLQVVQAAENGKIPMMTPPSKKDKLNAKAYTSQWQGQFSTGDQAKIDEAAKSSANAAQKVKIPFSKDTLAQRMVEGSDGQYNNAYAVAKGIYTNAAVSDSVAAHAAERGYNTYNSGASFDNAIARGLQESTTAQASNTQPAATPKATPATPATQTTTQPGPQSAVQPAVQPVQQTANVKRA